MMANTEENQEMTYIDTRQKYEAYVASVTDEELEDLTAVVHRRLLIPNWFTREMLEDMTRQDITEEDWSDFLEWVDDCGIPDRLSADLRLWWQEYWECKAE